MVAIKSHLFWLESRNPWRSWLMKTRMKKLKHKLFSRWSTGPQAKRWKMCRTLFTQVNKVLVCHGCWACRSPGYTGWPIKITSKRPCVSHMSCSCEQNIQLCASILVPKNWPVPMSHHIVSYYTPTYVFLKHHCLSRACHSSTISFISEKNTPPVWTHVNAPAAQRRSDFAPVLCNVFAAAEFPGSSEFLDDGKPWNFSNFRQDLGFTGQICLFGSGSGSKWEDFRTKSTTKHGDEILSQEPAIFMNPEFGGVGGFVETSFILRLMS